MPATIEVVPTGPDTFSVFVTASHRRPTQHRVVVTPDFLCETGLETAGPERVAHQVIQFLAGITSAGPIPEQVDLRSAADCDQLLVQSLRRSMSL